MSEIKKNLVGKRFHTEDTFFTVYGVTENSVFAYEGDIMETNDKGEVLHPRYFDYETVENNLVTAGRPSLGTTKKVSLTLPNDLWLAIDVYKETWGVSQSQVLRRIIEDYITEEVE